MALGRIERRLAAAIVLTALIPLLAGVYFAQSAIQRTASRFFNPEIRSRLDEALGVYQDLARAEKNEMRGGAATMALSPELGKAVAANDPAATKAVLAT